MAHASNAITSPPAVTKAGWTAWIGPLLVAGPMVAWWIDDLSFQWATLVEYRFGWIVVMLAGFLIWERLPTLPKADQPASFGTCALLAALGAPLVLTAELYKNTIAQVASTSFILSIGIALMLAAQLLFWRGPATLRHFIFPLAFMFVAVPLPKSLWDPVVLGLQSFVTWVDVQVLRLSGVAAVQMGHVIQLPNATVGVDEACSGVRSLQSSIMAALFIGDLTLRRLGPKTAFLVAGVLLAIGGNIFRSLYLAYTAYRSGADALKAVHDTAGWSVLLFTAAGLVCLAWIAGRIDKAGAPQPAPR
jgi:exosortase